jgi:hypothetical protein
MKALSSATDFKVQLRDIVVVRIILTQELQDALSQVYLGVSFHVLLHHSHFLKQHSLKSESNFVVYYCTVLTLLVILVRPLSSSVRPAVRRCN